MIGAGFSGVAASIHLSRGGANVTLIERSDKVAAGVAYSTRDTSHLLNVRAGRMSLFEDEPGHFVAWMSGHGLRDPDAFVPRRFYAEYLGDLIRQAGDQPAGAGSLRVIHGEAVGLMRRKGQWLCAVSSSEDVESDFVVLALGNPAPAPPEPLAAITESPVYFNDPWRAGSRLLETNGTVLLVGTGLTMADLAISLRSPARRLIALSRRGVLPHEHHDGHAAGGGDAPQGSPLGVLRTIRRDARARPWRDVLDQLRPHTQALWRSWSPQQQRQALRHVRPYWDAHRHRLAPSVSQQLSSMRAGGELEVMAARLVSARLDGDALEVTVRRRGSPDLSGLRVDAIVNCTGPSGVASADYGSLAADLFKHGLATPDQHGLGLTVDERHRVRNGDGLSHPDLFALGPLTRGIHWEITAVPDIRKQAAAVATTILKDR